MGRGVGALEASVRFASSDAFARSPTRQGTCTGSNVARSSSTLVLRTGEPSPVTSLGRRLRKM